MDLGAMDLSGTWLAREADDELRRRLPDPGLDDRDWVPVTVPGHWRSEAAFASSDGPLLYRRRFHADEPGATRRSWLHFAGMFYQGDVWLDGAYLGDTEGYFFPHSFEVTDRLAAGREHVLAVEVACNRPTDRRAKRNLTGIFEHWDCINQEWTPGGIWAPVTLDETGPVRIVSLRVTCREATAERATLDLEAEIDTLESGTVSVATVVAAQADTAAEADPGVGAAGPLEAAVVAERSTGETLAAGVNRVRWRVIVDRPALWWPHALGAQPLHTVTVSVGTPAGCSDRRTVTTGLRQIRMRNFVASVNGERLFLKGTNCGPTRRALAEATPEQLAGDVDLARQAGLDLVRVHAHVTRPEFYDAADRAGMLIWQDLPLQWGYARVRRQAVRQARQAVTLLGHHPSLAIWCGHNEPLALERAPGDEPDTRAVARFLAGQMLPTWNKTALDRSIKRALEKADGTRPVVAHSGVLPHPAGGTDSHLYFGWYHGDERDLPRNLARFPILARFVGEFGAQAVPANAAFAHPERWPALDWDELGGHHSLQKTALDRHVPPGGHATFDEWRDATQAYQATLIRFHIETLRRLKYRPTGGFCQFFFADAQPAISWSVLDYERQPKAGYHALASACAPVIVVADRPAPSYGPGQTVALAVHVVNDLRMPITGTTTATLRWPGGSRTWHWSGGVAADAVARVGKVAVILPPFAPVEGAEVTLDLRLRWNPTGGEASSSEERRTAARYTAAVQRGPGTTRP
ncbi:MAG: glycoside hydrolase family 2 protein [Acidimicrobiales bacterium]